MHGSKMVAMRWSAAAAVAAAAVFLVNAVVTALLFA